MFKHLCKSFFVSPKDFMVGRLVFPLLFPACRLVGWSNLPLCPIFQLEINKDTTKQISGICPLLSSPSSIFSMIARGGFLL